MGIAKEVTGRLRNRVWVYQEYLNNLDQDDHARTQATTAKPRRSAAKAKNRATTR
jgi:hypothetical protein